MKYPKINNKLTSFKMSNKMRNIKINNKLKSLFLKILLLKKKFLKKKQYISYYNEEIEFGSLRSETFNDENDGHEIIPKYTITDETDDEEEYIEYSENDYLLN